MIGHTNIPWDNRLKRKTNGRLQRKRYKSWSLNVKLKWTGLKNGQLKKGKQDFQMRWKTLKEGKEASVYRNRRHAEDLGEEELAGTATAKG